jgi:hypothetical protein
MDFAVTLLLRVSMTFVMKVIIASFLASCPDISSISCSLLADRDASWRLFERLALRRHKNF